MFVFQLPYLPELLMKARDYKLLERVFFSKTLVSVYINTVICVLVCHRALKTKEDLLKK